MKKLISTQDVRNLYYSGQKELVVTRDQIITPEARDLAKVLSMKVVYADDILSEVKTDTDLIRNLVSQVLERLGQTDAGQGPRMFNAERDPSGITPVRGDTVKMGKFDSAIPGQHIGLTDLITEKDSSPMAAGLTCWDTVSFPWTLNYHEIDIVLDGQLDITIDGRTYSGKRGDVFYIPKGSSITFGTPTFVKFFYVTYPAAWAEQ
ncbi:cupin domain-containing protein [Candidatus Hakubella thermalkaliphila]|uniref:Ethanolamine utilization protein EutQ n=1 Tax=Candidatus Hakubella thermalkaliphila TaxID=2754717 RepID=A0A6V8P7Y7_9ACTN|nr:ethanolamine utilization acetate kinase EutQ [Candidatus Hakubella thermalkaliphila]GFP28150.1 ethanolamine utilization protein EutQ [Candidatus Hakubella thermalkaliphila]